MNNYNSQKNKLNSIINVQEILKQYATICQKDKQIQRSNLALLSKYEKPRPKRAQSLLDQVLEKKCQLRSNLTKRKNYKGNQSVIM